ncbi:MAG TPA: hypothetical protein VL993_01505 [Stellaceae bacterium]|nr:hypothetical protein [Stellaceae bacterium]
MILSPVAAHKVKAAMAALAGAVGEPAAARALRRIAASSATRARGAVAARHHERALRLARMLGLGLRRQPPRASFGWDGRALSAGTEAYVLLHEVAHCQLAGPGRRRRIEFGLGPGPETGARDKALRHQVLHGPAREQEEAMASLLGILWEVELGQPALASFLDQNWLEGAGRPGAARHLASILGRLRAGRFITGTGRPTRRILGPY